MGTETEPATIRTTERSLAIVREVQKQGGVHLSDVVETFDMAKSTAYKHLKTLENEGYLVKEGSQYHIGLKFTNRGEYARARRPAYRIAANKVDELADRTDEEVDFMVENDLRGVTVHLSYNPTNPYQEQSVDPSNKHWRVGSYYLLHSIGAGKAILSEMSRESIEAVVETWGLPERTEKTISSRKMLFERMERIRNQGYVYSEGEYAEGLAALAMPATDPAGDLVGAFAVNGPTYNFQGETRQEELRSILADVVADYEAELEDMEHPDPFQDGTML